jgi:hypothetical protein
VGGALPGAGVDALAEGAAVAVAVEGLLGADEQGFQGRAPVVAGEGEGPRRGAVVAPVAAQQGVPAGGEAGDLDRVLVRVRAAEAEEHSVEAVRGEGQQPLRQRLLLRVDGAGHGHAEARRLRAHRLDHPRVPVPHVDVVGQAPEVEPPASVRGVEVGPCAAGDREPTSLRLGRPGEEEGRCRGLGHATFRTTGVASCRHPAVAQSSRRRRRMTTPPQVFMACSPKPSSDRCVQTLFG